jgi:DNA end-binding protein Ku
MASIWEGSIGFGLVEIPVVLKAAEQSTDEVSFTQLDRRDLAPVGYRRYNKRTGEEVEWKDIVKGYEYDDDRYVVISEEELRDAHPKVTKSVEIVQFVDASEIDPVFFDKPYYLEPRKRGSKAYALLRDTLKRTGKVAIGKVVVRTRQYLAAVTVRGPVLVLDLLRYSHEIREPEEIAAPGAKSSDVKVTPAEARMAEQLVESMSGPWKPEDFKDEYRDEVLSMVQQKVKSGKIRTIKEPSTERGDGKVIDLMSKLKESVEQRSGRRRPAAAKPAAAKRKSARRARSA